MWSVRGTAAGASAPALDGIAVVAIDGLSRPQKMLPCQLLYDARGGRLFEAITKLPEYYPTRTETAIIERHASEMARAVRQGGILVEFGSGSSRKTELLLAELPGLQAYVPVDVSRPALEGARRRLAARFPNLAVRPVVADFTRMVLLPPDLVRLPKTGFFPGSTIGNLTPLEAARWLYRVRALLGSRGHLMVGVDLEKDVRRLMAAYDDSRGVTAAFNLNLLLRLNREAGADFDLSAFSHRVIFDPREGRIEMHLVSRRPQIVTLRGHKLVFAEGETIHTESSYKYSIERFQNVARAGGWRPERFWTDPEGLFSVHELI